MKPTDKRIADVERELFRDLAIPDPIRRDLRARLDVLLLEYHRTTGSLTGARDQARAQRDAMHERLGALAPRRGRVRGRGLPHGGGA